MVFEKKFFLAGNGLKHKIKPKKLTSTLTPYSIGLRIIFNICIDDFLREGRRKSVCFTKFTTPYDDAHV